MRSIAVSIGVIGVACLALSAPLRAQDAAHALAQKFAEDAQAPAAPARVRSPPPPEYEHEMLERARAEDEQRRAQPGRQVPPPPAAPAARVATPPAKPAATPPADKAGETVASILVVLSHDGEGTPRQSFDPIICIGARCYVSAGPADPARAIVRSDALSTRHAISGGAGACAGKHACAFRAVPIGKDADLQIVNLGLVRHDARDSVRADIDTSCAIEGDVLMCDNPLASPDYRIWLVPEAVAASASAMAVEAALESELPQFDVTLDTDK